MTRQQPFVTQRKRPGIITAICILYWLHMFQLVACRLIFSVAMFRAGFRPALLVEPERLLPTFPPERWDFYRANPGVFGEAGREFSALFILSIAGCGLWKMRAWGRWVAIAGSILSMVSNLYIIVVSRLHPQEVVGFLFHSGILAVLLTRHVRLLFARHPPAPPKASVPAQEDSGPARPTKYI